MRIVSLAEVKAKLSAYLDEAEHSGPVVITRNGRAVAVLVAPSDEDDLERLLLSRSRRFGSLLAKSRSSIAAGAGIPHDDFWHSAEKRAAQQAVKRARRRVRRSAGKGTKSAPAAR